MELEGGLWGCIVIAAAFLIQVVAFGTSQCIGVYNVELLQYFNAGAAAVSLVGSINLGCFLGAGPLASILMTRYSCRQIALAGAVLANIGIITMPFAPNLPFMYVFYGVISGLGYCLLYVPSHVLSGLYFYKQRSCATGVATAGSGFGSSIFPIILYHLIDHYGWRGSFFIVAGLNMHLFVFAALLRPVPKSLLRSFKMMESADQRRKSVEMTVKREKVVYKNGNKKDLENEELEPMALEIVNEDISSRDVGYASDTKVLTENGFKDCDTAAQVVKNTEIGHDMNCKSPVLDDSNNKDPKLTLKEKLRDHCLSVITFDFIFFCLSNICWNAGAGILIIFQPEYLISVGISKEDASLVYTAIGAGGCVGCVAGGLLGNIKCFNRIILYIGGNIGGGLSTILMILPYFHTFGCMFTLSLLFGFMFGIILGLLVVVTSDLLGTEALSDGFGYLMLCNGMGVFGGPPLAGVIIDATGDLGLGVVFSAIMTALGGVVMSVVPIKRHFWGRVVPIKEIVVEIDE